MEQTRDSVLRYGEVIGCELLNFFVRQQERCNETMNSFAKSVHIWLSGTLAGAAIACLALLAVEYLLIPLPLNWHIREHERGQAIVKWIAQYALPGALPLGAIAGVLSQRFRPFRLGVASLAACCFAIAFFSMVLRPPSMARWPPNGPLPLSEVVPDMIFALFGWAGLVIAACGVVSHIGCQFRCGGPGMIWRVLHKCGAFIMCAGLLIFLSGEFSLHGSWDDTSIRVHLVQWVGIVFVLAGIVLAVVAAFGGHAEPGVGADSR